MKRLFDRLLRNRLGGRRSPPAPPSFEEGRLFAQLRQPAAAAEAWRAGQREAAWGAVIDHFRQRSPALGFIAPERVAALIDDAGRRFPAWRQRLLDKVSEERERGLAVYDRRAGPLCATFDWAGGPVDPLTDRLYQARPHRLGFLPRWAVACHYDRRVAGDLAAVLGGWMAAAQLPGGHPGFKSSHVVVYQFIALILAWPFIAALDAAEADDGPDRLRRQVLQCLYETSRFMRAVDASGVANNHRLAERLSDWLGAALLPEFDYALDRRDAEAAWLEELHRQTYADGGSIEHSVHYQEHACELAVIYLLLSRRNGWQVPAAARERIGRMLDFQLGLAGPCLLPLGFGNTTEDPLLPLGVGEGWQGGLLREVQGACFAPQAPAAADDDPTQETAFWLLDGKLAAGGGQAAPEAAFRDFPQSGFCVLAEPAAKARLTFRLGPSPGETSIGGHSHDDLLSLCLSVGGTMMLAPPGTYSYRFKAQADLPGQPNPRAHFAGAACRSGFTIEGSGPYGPLTGDFRAWRLPCQVAARSASADSAGLSWIEGAVVGEGPCVGQRRGVIHVWERYWLVYDRRPPASGGQPAAIGWQFAPGVVCAIDGEGRSAARAEAGGTALQLIAQGTGPADVASGAFEPFRGWVSPSYGRLEPAANLRFPLPGDSGDAATLLTLEPAGDLRLEKVLDAGGCLGFRAASSGEEGLLLLATGDEPAAVRWSDIHFQGRLLWLSRSAGALRIRALGLTRLTAPSWSPELTAATPADVELVIAGGAVQWPRGPQAALVVDRRRDDA